MSESAGSGSVCRHALLSVGIDIGTTSTHLSLSRLTLSNNARVNQAPRLGIADREIIYQSEIHQTPLADGERIDAEGVSRIILAEYKKAGFSPCDIDCGAAIVTGETARLRNAPAVVESLSAMAGDFVVASAGPHLESLLAARGSGAARYSAETGKTILNIDIGGGTSNFALISAGKPVETACLGIGARFIKFDREGRVESLTESGQVFLDATAKSAASGMALPASELELFGHLLAETILAFCERAKPPQIARRLLMTEALSGTLQADELWFSGGVAEFMVSPPSHPLQYSDMGGYLASALNLALRERAKPFRIARAPIRATVIGAGHYTVELSGSTVSASPARLPLKNLPLARLHFSWPEPGALAYVLQEAIENSFRLLDLDWSTQPAAIVLPPVPSLEFAFLSELARCLAEAYSKMNARGPLVALAAEDSAMAIGQLLRSHLDREEIVVLDGIPLDGGDYIDIGRPVAGGLATPLVFKTLVFQDSLP